MHHVIMTQLNIWNCTIQKNLVWWWKCSVCIVHFDNYKPYVATEHLKCGQCEWRIEFKILFNEADGCHFGYYSKGHFKHFSTFESIPTQLPLPTLLTQLLFCFHQRRWIFPDLEFYLTENSGIYTLWVWIYSLNNTCETYPFCWIYHQSSF